MTEEIAVTGANGFVGQHCVEHMIGAGHAVRALSRRRPAGLPPSAAWLGAPDLDPNADWTPCIAGTRAVVHCAARVHVMNEKSSDPLAEFRRVNRDGTLKLAEDCARADVRRFVFLSSIKVNGEATVPGEPFTATDSPRPVDAYGQSKLEAEERLFALGRETGMEIAVIRPVLVYGPGVKANFRSLMQAIARGIPLPIGAARGRRSLVGVTNLVDLVRVACTEPAAAGRVFLAADGDDMTTAELAQRLGDALGRPARLLPVPPGLACRIAGLFGKTAAAERVFGSLTAAIDDAEHLLGWSPPMTVDEELRRTAAAFRASTANST